MYVTSDADYGHHDCNDKDDDNDDDDECAHLRGDFTKGSHP